MQEALAAKEAAERLEIRALPVRQYLVHYTMNFLDRVKIFINAIISRSTTITFCVNAVQGLKWTPKPKLLIQSDQSNEDEVFLLLTFSLS